MSKALLFSCAASILANGICLSVLAAPQPLDFNRDIRPILSNKCFHCHGPDETSREAGLRLDQVKDATSVQESGSVPIVPGDPGTSEVLRRVTHPDESERMPPSSFGSRLAREEIEVLRRWIAEGARYADHWSYTKPVRPVPPAAPKEWQHWPRNEIDLFALETMLAHGLHPAPEADRYTLARRVWLDLTGLPPTIAEIDAFVENSDPQSYEKLVDELLQRPSYGEHWARLWLDLARYADSAGYADDPPREIWAYRDWVIQAIAENKPFDQFTIEQLAGDLLPNPSAEQLIATAFHRNTMTNSEGGTQDEEFRVAAVVDRVNTTMAVWMGTTIACAQCHNHKYDPISQREYFQLFAIFNNSADMDRRDEMPVLAIYTPEQRKLQDELPARIALFHALLSLPSSGSMQPTVLAAQVGAIAKVMQPATTVPVMRELEHPRETRLHHRGNYLDPGPKVEPGLPAVFHPAPSDRPLDRLAFARWLVDRDNPLTARVIANRYWETLFGSGLVTTSEDFGSQGELPSHPKLLDWLAVELMESGWDTRALIRRIVTSAVYRQSSCMNEKNNKADPENRWLARGPRVRLSAEMIRDQALAVSGLLSKKMYGPPVRPLQPTMGLSAAFGSSTDWQTSEGEDRYRRAIYTMWRRSNPYPSMTTFDAPNREVCTLKRSRTNTPLQALATLNDPVYVEAAQALARRALEYHSALEEQISHAFRHCLLRPPDSGELQVLVKLYHDSRQHLAARPEAAIKLATVPLGDLPPGIDPIDAAAMSVVGNVLLNLDEMFLKR